MRIYPLPTGRVAGDTGSSPVLMDAFQSSFYTMQRGPKGPQLVFTASPDIQLPGANLDASAPTSLQYVGFLTRDITPRGKWPSVSASERQALRGEAKAPPSAPYWRS